MSREDRTHELRLLKQTNPQRLIALYRAVTGSTELGQLPPGVGFEGMIDAIVDHEMPAHPADEQTL